MNYIDIKTKRKCYKISQTKLSEASGYTKSQISSWELEKSFPSDNQLIELDKACLLMIS